MRKLVATTMVSLDGVMQAPGGPEEDPTGGFAFGGWSFPYWDDAPGREHARPGRQRPASSCSATGPEIFEASGRTRGPTTRSPTDAQCGQRSTWPRAR